MCLFVWYRGYTYIYIYMTAKIDKYVNVLIDVCSSADGLMGCGHEWRMFHITKPLAANTCVALPLVIARSLARTEVTCPHSTIWSTRRCRKSCWIENQAVDSCYRSRFRDSKSTSTAPSGARAVEFGTSDLKLLRGVCSSWHQRSHLAQKPMSWHPWTS